MRAGAQSESDCAHLWSAFLMCYNKKIGKTKCEMATMKRFEETEPKASNHSKSETLIGSDSATMNGLDDASLPLDPEALERGCKLMDAMRDQKMDRHEIEFWKEFGDKAPF